MNADTLLARNLALWLLSQETLETKPSKTIDATFRVCEKLRQSLSILAGAAGYRSLICRALTLAMKETRSLEKVRVKEDGLFITLTGNT